MKKFNRRTYRNPADFFRDLSFPFRNRRRLRDITRRETLSPAFRERLMLAVTAVNGCRYCSYFHARQALKSGVKRDEVRQLLAGDVTACPEEEAVAVLYAQHWAESNAHPDPEAVQTLQQTYGRERAEAIDLVLRMIRLGNLMGNTWDALLYRLSFGHCGA